MMAIAGSLAGKKSVPASAGTFPVTTPLFTVLLTGVILIVGALTFFPALVARPDPRAPAAARRPHLLTALLRRLLSLCLTTLQTFACSLFEGTHHANHRSPKIATVPPSRSAKLNPRVMMKNPVMFVVEIGQRPHNGPPCIVNLGASWSLQIQPSDHACGSGSRCSSRTSPRPWQKAAAKHRPTRCAWPRV